MGAKRKSYTPKYRQDAAHLVIDTGRTIARSRLDDPPDALDVTERAELERLRRENTELRMDREFLKKAAAFFATENSSPSGRSR